MAKAGTYTAVGGALGGVFGAGLGATIGGWLDSTAAAKEQNQIQQQMIGTEQQQNTVRRQAMELMASRQQMELVRNVQRARSMSLNNATSQGAAYGDSSGYKGGLAQVQNAGAWNMLGINQNLELGRNMFDLDTQLSNEKIAYAKAGGELASGQAWMSLGGTMMNSIKPIHDLMPGMG